MKRERIGLADHFTFKKLLRFTFPSIVMMVFASVYSIVDGVFVSNTAGDSAFAGLNLIMPVILILGGIGLMFGSGGSALISKTLGEGDGKRANGYFTLFVIVIAIVGVALGGAGIAALRPVAELLGRDATPETVENAVLYGWICLCGLPFLMLQYSFQSFMITAEKSMLGFGVTVAAGLTNAALDALFILGFKWGLAGAAAATCVGQAVGGIVPIVYFARKNNSLLRFAKPKFEMKALLRACANGSSELLTNISTSVVGMVYNFRLLALAGDNGVIAYGVIMYVNMIFLNIFFGFSIGVAPVVGYHYGAENKEELKNLLKKGLIVTAVFSALLTAIAEGCAYPFSAIFTRTGSEAFELTQNGMRLYSLAYLFMGFNIFGSAFFTALNDGLVSAAISFSRTLLFQLGAVLLLPLLWGIRGVWLAVVVAEFLALVVTFVFFLAMRKKYGYWVKKPLTERGNSNIINPS